jgi:hypothetical protein
VNAFATVTTELTVSVVSLTRVRRPVGMRSVKVVSLGTPSTVTVAVTTVSNLSPQPLR